MMRTYEGTRHCVVGLHLARATPAFFASGPQPTDIPCDDVIFEIGSITKVFTGILLCLLVEEGKVDPRAPLREMADDLADVPPHLTPERLISHTSGLPNIYMPIWRAAITPMPDGHMPNSLVPIFCAGCGLGPESRAACIAMPIQTSALDCWAKPWRYRPGRLSWTCSPKGSSYRLDWRTLPTASCPTSNADLRNRGTRRGAPLRHGRFRLWRRPAACAPRHVI